MENQTPGTDTPPTESPVTSEPVAQSGSYKPGEYYSTPPVEKKGCPKPLIIGCGGAGCIVLLLLFAAGAYFVARPGVMLTFLADRILGEIDRMAESDVTTEEKDALRSELRAFRANVKTKSVDMTKVQPMLQKINAAIRDRKLTKEEVNDLTESLREINEGVTEKRGSTVLLFFSSSRGATFA